MSQKINNFNTQADPTTPDFTVKTSSTADGLVQHVNVDSLAVVAAATASETIVPVTNTAGGTQILAANSSRKGGEVRVSINASKGVFIERGTSASAASRFYAPGDIISLANGVVRYTGAIFAFVTSGTENVEVTEL